MDNDRTYDFVIFGASGFTGQFVVKEVQRIAQRENIKWAIAGRNKKKLANVITNQTDTDGDSFSDVILADINDYQSLLLMCKQTKVVLDCVGPYRFYGEPVVKACVEAKANYVDICGEPQFLENMLLKYDEGAKKSDVYIVGACGFDSIPSDLGVMFAKQEFSGTLNGLEAYLKVNSGPSGSGLHFGTYESAVHGASDTRNLKKIREALNLKRVPLVGPKLKLKGAVHYHSPSSSYAIPFLGADVSLVKRSQRYLYEKLDETPIQYSMYACVGGLWNLILLTLFGGIFQFLANRSWGRSLLLKHPKFFTAGLFSHEGPTKQQIEESSFYITMYGEGYSEGGSALNRVEKPDKTIVVRVGGPEAGYVTTPIAMVQAALVIVKEKNKLPEQGGVYSPGAAFFQTSLIERLQQNGMKFEVLG